MTFLKKRKFDDISASTKKSSFSTSATLVLKKWLLSDGHFGHPYPNSQERHALAQAAEISPKQVRNWFVNARKRIWQPLLLEMGAKVGDFITPGRQANQFLTANDMKNEGTSNDNGLKVQQILLKARQQLLEEVQEDEGIKQEPVGETIVSSTLSKRKNLQTSVSPEQQQTSLLWTNDSDRKKRKGAWTVEEERYAKSLIDSFLKGRLQSLPNGTTLRMFLANELSCDPMRISKKFSKEARYGKLFYTLSTNSTDAELAENYSLLQEKKNAFLTSLEMKALKTTYNSALKKNVTKFAKEKNLLESLVPAKVELSQQNVAPTFDVSGTKTRKNSMDFWAPDVELTGEDIDAISLAIGTTTDTSTASPENNNYDSLDLIISDLYEEDEKNKSKKEDAISLSDDFFETMDKDYLYKKNADSGSNAFLNTEPFFVW